jgi:hypothetical protein
MSEALGLNVRTGDLDLEAAGSESGKAREDSCAEPETLAARRGMQQPGGIPAGARCRRAGAYNGAAA